MTEHCTGAGSVGSWSAMGHHLFVSNQAKTVVLGTEGNGVAITVFGREFPGVDDFWDGNWVRTSIHVTSGGMSANLDAALRTDEFSDFADQVAAMNRTLTGTAIFETMENWLRLAIRCSRTGSLEINGIATDTNNLGNTLEFTIAGLDQTYLAPLATDLTSLLELYPVIGRP